SLQVNDDGLLVRVSQHEPRRALETVDAKLRELADRIRQLSPALTLAPIQNAIDRVKAALTSLDVDAQIEPVRSAFDGIVARVEEFKPSTLLSGVEDPITTLRPELHA